jgi:hypothetical protein
MCIYCGGPDGVFSGPGHSYTCPRYRKPPRRQKTIGRKSKALVAIERALGLRK